MLEKGTAKVTTKQKAVIFLMRITKRQMYRNFQVKGVYPSTYMSE